MHALLGIDLGTTGVKAALFSAEDGQVLSAVYSKPLIGHGSIGPSCGIATVSDSGVEIWSHSQNVFALRDQVARVLTVWLQRQK